MKYSEILNELAWEDRFSAADACRKYPNKWIHFSKIDKIGINPKKTHRDPPGIYFYPCQWLLGEDTSIHQYATDNEYYFIASIKPTARTLNLGRVTKKQIETIAKNNGWFDDMQECRRKPELLDNPNQPMDRKLLKRVGGFFYACMDYLVEFKKRNWIQMLKGIDVIIDPGYGIIASQEPAQMIVLNYNQMVVVDRGINKDNSQKIYASLMKELAEKYQGAFRYKNKNLIVHMIFRNNPISIFLNPINRTILVNCFEKGFLVNNIERIEDTHFPSVDWLESKIRYMARNAEPYGKDFSWTGEKIEQIILKFFVDKRRGLSYLKYLIRDNNYHINYSLNIGWSIRYGIFATIHQNDSVTFRLYYTHDFRTARNPMEISLERNFTEDQSNDVEHIAKMLHNDFIDAIFKKYDITERLSQKNDDKFEKLTFNYPKLIEVAAKNNLNLKKD